MGKKPNLGFTLLELIVAITVLVLMAAILAGVVKLSFRSVNAGEKKIRSLERIRASLNLLEWQLNSQVPLAYAENGETRYYFYGSETTLEFSTNYARWGGQRGYVVASYRIEPGESGRYRLNYLERMIGREEAQQAGLLEEMDKISFHYYDRDPAQEQGLWREEWTDTRNIPEKVRVDLVWGGKDFSLIFPLKARGALASPVTKDR
jgi:general secretion pathway protein J